MLCVVFETKLLLLASFIVVGVVLVLIELWLLDGDGTNETIFMGTVFCE